MEEKERLAQFEAMLRFVEVESLREKAQMDALKAAPADTVRLELTTGVAPCVILPTDDSGKFIYMVLPVRLKAGD